MRIVLFTGKGGVGKTTIAAATAVRCADAGRRTLVVSTDPAHSLADVFDQTVGPTPTELAPNLWAEQLDARQRMEESWADIQEWLREVFNWAGVDGVQAEELSVLPGLEEVFALADIGDHAASSDWDVLVVDCAPTAETIRLLSLPDVLAWYMDRVFPVSRRVNRVLGPLVARMSSLPVAGDDVYAAARRFYSRLEGVKALLADPERASVRLVVNPERVVIAEARRTHTYLSLFGYRVDAVVANRLLPDDVSDPWFDSWRARHAEHLATIGDAFAPVPVLRAELADAEPVGDDALRRLGRRVYGDEPADAVLHVGETMAVEPDGAGLVLCLPLPSASRDELDVGRNGDELLIRVGPYRRAVLLPDSLLRRPIEGASLANGQLRVCFGERDATGSRW